MGGIFTKNADNSNNIAEDLARNSKEPEVVKAVVAEVNKLGDRVKTSYDELRRNHEEIKKTVDKLSGEVNALDKEKLQKLTEDVATRQDLLDKKLATDIADGTKAINDRIDQIEIAMKRPGGEVSDAEKVVIIKDARDFFITAMAVQDKSDQKGATFDRVKSMNIDVEAYKAYRDAFEVFLRKDDKLWGGQTSALMKSLSVGSDQDGGITVTPFMSNRIIARMFESDPLRQLAAIETISTGAITMRVDFGEADCGWEAEITAGAETTTAKLGEKRIPVHVMYAKPRATQTLLEDSGINIEAWLSDKIATKMLRTEGAALVTGDGVGKPRGF